MKLSDTQTHLEADWTDSFTSTTDAAGKYDSNDNSFGSTQYNSKKNIWLVFRGSGFESLFCNMPTFKTSKCFNLLSHLP